MSLFFGLSIQAWGTMLVPDDTPLDRFMDANPDAHTTFGESGEPGIAIDLRNCSGQNGTGRGPALLHRGRQLQARSRRHRQDRREHRGRRLHPPPAELASTCLPAARAYRGGTVDPLMGLDFFLGSNLSLKNPNFRSLRCGECHAGGTLTDHTFEISHQVSFGDRIQEFITGQPGVELFPEALGRGRVIPASCSRASSGERAGRDRAQRRGLRSRPERLPPGPGPVRQRGVQHRGDTDRERHHARRQRRVRLAAVAVRPGAEESRRRGLQPGRG